MYLRVFTNLYESVSLSSSTTSAHSIQLSALIFHKGIHGQYCVSRVLQNSHSNEILLSSNSDSDHMLVMCCII